MTLKESVQELQTKNEIPSLDEFLQAPNSEVAAVAPKSMIFYTGGTRRKAALMDIKENSDEFASYSFNQMIECIDQIFQHGVQQLFVPLLGPKSFSEVGAYRSKLIEWTGMIAHDQAIAAYGRLDCNVRLLEIGDPPELDWAKERLLEETSSSSKRALWFLVDKEQEASWSLALKAARSGAETHNELLQAIFDEPVIPPIILVGHGKPELQSMLPILIKHTQCYWTQKPGYELDKQLLRTIFYDYLYLRETWKREKKGRAGEVKKYREMWENPPVIGLGQRTGPFWFPVLQPEDVGGIR